MSCQPPAAARASCKAAGLAGVAEFTYLSHRGRNLERIGKATLAPRTALVERVARQLTPRLHESLGLRGLAGATVFQWLWGWLTHRGGGHAPRTHHPGARWCHLGAGAHHKPEMHGCRPG